MASLFINDGYTLEHTIPAKGQLPAVKIKYRPALPEAAHEYRFEYGAAKEGKARMAAETRLIMNHLVAWDAEDQPGQVAKINEQTLARVPDNVRGVLVETILWGIEKAAADEKN